ncbi:Holliday junction resolvase RuvX [Spiroplasma endosymbiont of Labia minor]|uniref:Holliday junction resolvase RuvX n=1 Tax=Spiroplasma endosymbiont of Labia minor TaxID=3066305 RepID=UPI0030CD55C6
MVNENIIIWGLDLGTKTLGIAHNIGQFAFPFKTIKFIEYDFEDCVKKLEILMLTIEIPNIVVIGYPINMNATVGKRAEMVIMFIETYLTKLQNKFTFGITKIDERLTTKMALSIMHQSNTKFKTKNKEWKQKKDEVAAQLILESFLRQQKP